MTSCLVLAAGEGTRMNSTYPKVLLEVLGVPMLSWVLDSVNQCEIKNKCVVVGYHNQEVVEFLKNNNYDCEISFQYERKGTAHAVSVSENFIKKNINDDILILGGDSPFIDPYIIRESYKHHKENKNKVTIISSIVDNPYGYGRIVRDINKNVRYIVEERDSNSLQRKIKEINSGAYWFDAKSLMNEINNIEKSVVSGEFYLTSIISIFIKKNLKVGAFCSPDSSIILGANTQEELETLNKIAKDKLISSLIAKGVNIPYVDSVSLGKNVEIGEGTTILSDVSISPFTKIGKNCVIGPKTNIFKERIGDNAHLMFYNSNQNYFDKELEKENVI